MRTAAKLLVVALGVATIAVLPQLVGDFRSFQLARAGIFFIAIVGLNLLTGSTGQISLGHGAFMAIGGYTTAILVADHGIRDLWTIPLAGLVAGLAGLLFGLPALRLSGLYLALATFALAVAAPAVLKKAGGLTGGSGGINLFERGLTHLTGALTGTVTVLGHRLTLNDFYYYLAWTIGLVLLGAAWLIVRGRVGRAFRAIRDSEVAATSSGINLSAYKTLAFAISGFYAGVAGSLLVLVTQFVNPQSFQFELSVLLLVGTVVGGLGSLWGAALGALFVEFVPIWAQDVSKRPGAPSVVFGLALIAAMLVLPTGVAGLRGRARLLTTRLYSRS